MTTVLADPTVMTLTAEQQLAWFHYQRLRTRLSGRISRELARAELSEAEFEVMLALSARGESVRALALRCGLDWEKSRLSHQLRRMEARGLIVRATCEEDGRSTVILLTPAGRERLTAATALYQTAVAELVMAALTPVQLAAFDEISRAILAQLDATGNPDDARHHDVTACPALLPATDPAASA